MQCEKIPPVPTSIEHRHYEGIMQTTTAAAVQRMELSSKHWMSEENKLLLDFQREYCNTANHPDHDTPIQHDIFNHHHPLSSCTRTHVYYIQTIFFLSIPLSGGLAKLGNIIAMLL